MTDVAVIGGGITGCATAALLAEAGRHRHPVRARGDRGGRLGPQLGDPAAPDGPGARAALRGFPGPLRRPRRLRAARAGRRADRRRARRPAGGVRGGRRTLPGADARVARGRRSARRRARPRRRSLRVSRERRAADRADRRHQRMGGESTGGRRADRRRRRRVRRARRGPSCRRAAPGRRGGGRGRAVDAGRDRGRRVVGASPTGASSPRCACATRHATGSSRRASRR